MSAPKYDEDFKKSIVALYQAGKSQSQLSKEYGVSQPFRDGLNSILKLSLMMTL